MLLLLLSDNQTNFQDTICNVYVYYYTSISSSLIHDSVFALRGFDVLFSCFLALLTALISFAGTSTSEEVSSDSIEDNDDEHIESVLGMPWFSSLSHSNISLRRKELSRDRKQKWIFKSTQIHRFDRLVNLCGQKLGTDATIRVFGKLGRETGVKEFNALVALCIEKARETLDEDVWLQEITKAYKLLMLMRERGFQLEEESYGPFLMLLIDMELVEEFQYFCGAFLDGNSNSLPRVAYYEMLLWIRVNNEVKIKELCDLIVTNDEGDNTNFKGL